MGIAGMMHDSSMHPEASMQLEDASIATGASTPTSDSTLCARQQRRKQFGQRAILGKSTYLTEVGVRRPEASLPVGCEAEKGEMSVVLLCGDDLACGKQPGHVSGGSEGECVRACQRGGHRDNLLRESPLRRSEAGHFGRYQATMAPDARTTSSGNVDKGQVESVPDAMDQIAAGWLGKELMGVDLPKTRASRVRPLHPA